MLRIEKEMPLSEWEKREDAFCVYSESFLKACNLDNEELECVVVQSLDCVFYLDYRQKRLCFDLQVLRFFLRLNVFLLCDRSDMGEWSDALSYLGIMQETLRDQLTAFTSEAVNLCCLKITKWFENFFACPDIIESIPYKRAFEFLKTQATFLTGHEIYHYYLSKDAKHREVFITEFNNRVTDFGIDWLKDMISLEDPIRNNLLLEECACDSFSCRITLNTLIKEKNANCLDVALALYIAILNQFTILFIKTNAIAHTKDTVSEMEHVNRALWVREFRLECLSNEVLCFFKENNLPFKITEDFLLVSAELEKRWLEMSVKRQSSIMNEYSSSIIAKYEDSETIPYYFKVEERIKNEGDFLEVERLAQKLLFSDWDVLDAIF